MLTQMLTASVEEDNDADTDVTVTSTTDYRTNPPDSRASTDVSTNVEKEQAGADVRTEANPDTNSPGPKQYAPLFWTRIMPAD